MNYEYLFSLCPNPIYVYGATLSHKEKIKTFLQHLSPKRFIQIYASA